MRLIGHLTEKANALTFSDFLYVQGISNDLEGEKDGWAIWVHGEDEVPRAKELLAQFQSNPKDPKYREHAREASQIKEKEQFEEEKAKKRHFDRTKLFQQSRPYGIGPLTLSIVLVCVGVAVLSKMGSNLSVVNNFSITQYWRGGFVPGLPEISSGQVWRLITPIFIHYGALHLIFNMMAMLDLGSMVEARGSSGRLAVLVLVIGVVSNVAQYSFDIRVNDWPHVLRFRGSPNFGGISGVAFGLMGYIWMKARFDPGSGFFLNTQAVMMMLVWFVLCLIGVIPHIANTAHTAGLLTGMLWGYLSSLRSKMR